MSDAATFRLTRHEELLAVMRLGAGADVPSWGTSSTLFSVTATRSETSVVCSAASVPARAHSQGPFVAFEVDGPLDFALTGVLSTLLAPLADAGVSVFTLSTFDTDWILVGAGDADTAVAVWRESGQTVDGPDVEENA